MSGEQEDDPDRPHREQLLLDLNALLQASEACAFCQRLVLIEAMAAHTLWNTKSRAEAMFAAGGIAGRTRLRLTEMLDDPELEAFVRREQAGEVETSDGRTVRPTTDDVGRA